MQKIFVYLLAFMFVSCAVERPTGKTEAEVLFKESKELMSDKRYILATEKLNTLRSQYPYSFYATTAELMQADILFLQESFEESAAAYIMFKDFHPKSNKLDYVIYKIAESYYLQKPSTYDRDLTPAIKAIKFYNELKSLYPGSKFLKDANEKISLCNKMLLNKEKYIANFYFKTKDYKSAKFRYTNVLENVSVKEIRSLAVARLVRIGRLTNDPKLCRKIYTKYKSSLIKKSQKNVEREYLSCIKN